MKRILITGGGGFLGTNLVKKLLAKSKEEKEEVHIVIVDNFITGNIDNIEQFIKESSVDIYSFDICTQMFLDFIKDCYTTIDEIYHLASLASPPFYKKYPLSTLDVGYIGTRNVLEIAKEYKSRVLFSSTSEVYGNPDLLHNPQKESYYGNVNSFGDRSSYDESKRVAEALIYTYQREYDVECRIARIFNTFGPIMKIDDGRIVTEVIRCLLYNEELTIYGNGDSTRSLCYVDDTLDMLMKLMASDYNAPVNVGNNVELTINNIVKMIEKVYNENYRENYNKDAKLVYSYKPLTQNDPVIRRPDLTLNKQVLGEREYTQLEEGIKKTIEYFIEQKKK